jgi:hypothetical protein
MRFGRTLRSLSGTLWWPLEPLLGFGQRVLEGASEMLAGRL